VSLNGKDLSSDEVQKIVKNVTKYQEMLRSYDNHFDSSLLDNLVSNKNFNEECLKDKNLLEKTIQESIEEFKNHPTKKYSYEIKEDTEHGAFGLKIEINTAAKKKTFSINHYLVSSADFKDLKNIHESLVDYYRGSYKIITSKDDIYSFDNLNDLSDHLMHASKKGAYIQRYKGLGEMNPDQLWETTMNPENRRLLQVKLEDTIESDQVFSLLMGDSVEPRRQFVEENALSVRNLDV